MSNSIPTPPIQKQAYEPEVAGNEFWRSRCPVRGKLIARFFRTSQVDAAEYAKMDPQQLYARLYRINKKFEDGIVTPEFTMRVHTKKGWSTFNIMNFCRRNHDEEVGRCQLVVENPSDLFRRFFINTSFVFHACAINGVQFRDVMTWWDSLPQNLKDQAAQTIARVERIKGTPWSMCYIVFGQPKMTTTGAQELAQKIGGDVRWDHQFDWDETKDTFRSRVIRNPIRYTDDGKYKNVCINSASKSVDWANAYSYSNTNKTANMAGPNGVGIRMTAGYTLDNLQESWLLDLFRNVLNMPDEFYMVDSSNVLDKDADTEIYL